MVDIKNEKPDDEEGVQNKVLDSRLIETDILSSHFSKIDPDELQFIKAMYENPKEYLSEFDSDVVKILSDNNDLLTMKNLKTLRATIKELGFTEKNEQALKEIINEYNQTIEKIELPINQIKFLRDSIPSIMEFEEGSKQFLKEAYKGISIGSKLKIVKDEEQGRLIPVVENYMGDEYKLSSQPIVDSVPKVFKGISESDTINFINFLESFPFLAIENKVGKWIYKELALMADQMCVIIPRHAEFFRCRKWETGQTMAYTDSDMFAPYRAVTKAARFNNFGVSHLYMASSEETAKYEIGRCKKFNTLKAKNRNSLHLLKLAPEMNVIFSYCLRRQRDKAIFPREYLMPNFISQCCAYLNQTELHQIDGIRYPSTKNPSEFSFVLFNKSKDSFVDISLL